MQPPATPIRVTVWNEFRHEKTKEAARAVYPDGIHVALARHLSAQDGLAVRTATLDEPDHGLPDAVLEATDVIIWWGHVAHGEVRDDIVEKLHARILGGMGFIGLHSAHFSKIFRRLMGSSCDLKWRVADEREVLWVTKPGHPILQGISDHFVIAQEEMYGEHFDIPEPDELLLISSFAGGEVFRSGCTWTRGAGRIFYFRPGHETYPVYYQSEVLRIITNAVRWAAPVHAPLQTYGKRAPVGWFE